MIAAALYLVQDSLDIGPDDPGWGEIAFFLSPVFAVAAALVTGVLLTLVAVFRGIASSWQAALTACVAGTIFAPLVYGAAIWGPVLGLADALDGAHSALVYGVFVFLVPVLIGAGTVVAIALVVPRLSSARRAMRP